MKVLIVDDSAFMRQMIRKVVEEQGIQEIQEATNGGEAMTKYQEFKPNLVFMDIVMPEIDGIQGLKSIKSFDSEATIVMCTSVGQEKVIQEAVELGATDFITKPFNPDEIKEVITKFR